MIGYLLWMFSNSILLGNDLLYKPCFYGFNCHPSPLYLSVWQQYADVLQIWFKQTFCSFHNVGTNSTAFLRLSLANDTAPCAASFSGYYTNSGHVSPIEGMT